MRSTTLDDPQTYGRLDPTGMGGRIAQLPQQCQEAWRAGQAFSVPAHYSRVERVVFVGIGGSAIGGELVANLAYHHSAVPVSVVRDYTLPSFVDHRTLVLASSYSGNTEETLSAFQQAVERGVSLVALASGGLLEQRCRELGAPFFRIPYKGEPRSAIGYSFLVPLAILCKLGLIPPHDQGLEEAISLAQRLGVRYALERPTELNPAKGLAMELQGKLVVIYGAGILTTVARRWKTQVNENAKSWAFFELLPEANHNAVMGYPHPAAVARGGYVLLLQPATPHPRTQLRFRLTAELLEQTGVAYKLIKAEGQSALAQVLSTIYFGDYTSYYLAMLNGVDPSPVAGVEELKRRLGSS